MYYQQKEVSMCDNLKFKIKCVKGEYFVLSCSESGVLNGIAYLKELSIDETLSDRGIVHELVHLMTVDYNKAEVYRVRQLFKKQLKLS